VGAGRGYKECPSTLDPTGGLGAFALRHPSALPMDLTTAYRYNQNMMEYYTCSYNCFKTLLQNHFTVVLL
jgi:hypothetical protein